jgi:cytochrome c peroxidase
MLHRVSLLALAACAEAPGRPGDHVPLLPDLPDPVDPATDTYPWGLPDWAPRPPVPATNPMTPEKVAWGRLLFHDPQLSGNGTQSCASCHVQALGFADGRAVSSGSTGDATPRNSQGLVNVAYATTLTWANPALRTLEQQILVPLYGEQPVELGVTGQEATVEARLRADAEHAALAAEAFPDDAEPVTLARAVLALASFVRSMVSFDTPLDRFQAGELSELPTDVRLGMELFFSERLECHHCHGGWNYSLASTRQGDVRPQVSFQNNGSYNVGGTGAYPAGNGGLYEFTGDVAHIGQFRPPTLRNVALTGPYLHDGSTPTLAAVLDDYARGGRLVRSGTNAGDGAENPHKSTFVRGFSLDDEERAAVLAFLGALTDESFLADPRWSDPRR